MSEYSVELVIKENGKEIKKHVFMTTPSKKMAINEFGWIIQSDDTIKGISMVLETESGSESKDEKKKSKKKKSNKK